jgi:hypothetical protein
MKQDEETKIDEARPSTARLNRYYIPNIKLVGVGRTQTYQVCCLLKM